MKKIILFALMVTPSVCLSAWVESFNKCSSSYTTTNESVRVMPDTRPGNVLMAVLVSSGSGGGHISIFDSSGTGSKQIANIGLGNVGYYKFEVVLSSGLTYSTNGNSNGVTIIYKKTHAR